MNRRYGWVDVLRLLGIYCILIGHFSEYAGRFYPFVFAFHVPLFFFASGLMAGRGAARPVGEFVRRKAVRLLIPYAFYGAVCMLVHLIWMDGQLTDQVGYLRQLLLGVRNQLTFGQALWFLPCLFVQSVLYRLLMQAVPHRRARFALCLAAGAAARLLMDAPVLPWGIDNAVRYLPYYALGDLLMPGLERLEAGEASRAEKIGFGLAAAAALAVCAAAYWLGPDSLLLPLAAWPPLQLTAGVFLRAALMILAAVAVAFVLQRVPSLCRLGRYTLTVCGLESALRSTLNAALKLLGLQLDYTNPYCVLLLCGALVWLGCRAGVWLERYYPLAGGYRPARQKL